MAQDTTTAAETTPPPVKKKTFLDVPSAARMAGFSIRHFRRIIEEDEIPIMQIGRKFFIVAANFEDWKARQGQKRMGEHASRLDS
jgi:hypothetical protein